MGKSVLVFVSHSSEDKESFIEPLVEDLRKCYVRVWYDKDNIVPGDNLRQSIFRDGLDKADIALIFFTQQSLQSSWVDREIKHVLREEGKKGNNFDLNKIISIYDSKETYNEIVDRYPELTDDLLHLMPADYGKTHLGQLISAIWSKYFSLEGGDVETQRQLLEKEKEIFQKEKEIQELKSKNSKIALDDEFASYLNSGKLDKFIQISHNNGLFAWAHVSLADINNMREAVAFGLIEVGESYKDFGVTLTEKGKDFFNWYYLNHDEKTTQLDDTQIK